MSQNGKVFPCVKIVRIRSFSGLYFHIFRLNTGILLWESPYSVRIRENTDQKIWAPFNAVFAAIFLKCVWPFWEIMN